MSCEVDCTNDDNFWFDAIVTAHQQTLIDAGLFVHLVNSGYVPRKSVDVTEDNIPAASIIATQPLPGAIASSRRLYGNQVDFPDLASSYGSVKGILITTGDNALVAYIGSAHGLGIEPDGTTVSLKWDVDGIAGL